jgi:phosphoribosylformimino-5-aminoimidazole carboxamide ribotide isomerase
MFVIPAIDLKDGKCVRLTQGRLDQMKVYSEDPVEVALRWEKAGASTIHVVDLDGAFTGESRNLDWVARICAAVKCHVQTGGGLRTREAVERALGAGARRVVVGTKALSEPFLDRLLASFGESIIVGIDAKDGKLAIQGWTQKSAVDAYEFARKVSAMGAMRVVFTDVQTDGMLSGPPLASIGRICVAFSAGMVVASGGVKDANDVRAIQGLGHANLEGVIVGKALYEGTLALDRNL